MQKNFEAPESTREALVGAARGLREITQKILKDPVGYTRAAVVIVLAVKRVYARALREAQENKQS